MLVNDHIAQFLSPRGGSNYWSTRADLIEAWRQGSQLSVPPLATEYACILDCNCRCPTCPYHQTQLKQCDGIVPMGELATVNDRTTGSFKIARIVLEQSRKAGVAGILFTGGGEPLIWPPLLEALKHSHQLGMDNAIYTNGLMLGFDPQMASRLMDPKNGLAFIRVSINAVSPDAVKIHWGLSNPNDIENQFIGLHRLLEARNELAKSYGEAAIPSVQISTIVDKHTINDLDEICERVADVFQKARTATGSEDVMVVRPLTIHGRNQYSTHDHEDRVIRMIIDVCGEGGTGRQRLADATVRLFLGFGLDRVESGEIQSYNELLEDEYAQRDVSLSVGVWLVVGPNASVYNVTEHNCRGPEFAIGNLTQQSVEEVFRGARRKQLLGQMNEEHWGPTSSQPTPRTARLDRIARSIQRGELTNGDIEVIRRTALGSHKLLLD